MTPLPSLASVLMSGSFLVFPSIVLLVLVVSAETKLNFQSLPFYTAGLEQEPQDRCERVQHRTGLADPEGRGGEPLERHLVARGGRVE